MARKKNTNWRKKKRKNLKRNLIAFALLSAVLLVSLLFSAQIDNFLGLKKQVAGDSSNIFETNAPGLSVHFVDVGQGDAQIVYLPDGQIGLIDGGSDSQKQKLLSYIDENVLRNGAALTYFDFALLTHADEDHCGGFDDVLEKYPAKVFYRPNVAATYSGYSDPNLSSLSGIYVHSTLAYMKAIKAATTTSNVVVNVLNKNYTIASQTSQTFVFNIYPSLTLSNLSANNHSPFMYIQYQSYSFMLSGDAEEEREAEFVNYISANLASTFNSSFNISVLKLGHHGSSSSTSQIFLEALTNSNAVANTYAVISCGANNKYGHPTSAVLNRLSVTGFSSDKVLRTDILSSIVFSVRVDDNSASSTYGTYQLFNGAAVTSTLTPYYVSWREIVIGVIIVLFLFLVLRNIKIS